MILSQTFIGIIFAFMFNSIGFCFKRLTETNILAESINIKNKKYSADGSPVDPECDCPVCRRYSRAYIRHLFKAEEMLAMRFSVMHNLYFYNELMRRIKESLHNGNFESFRKHYSSLLDTRI